MQDIVEVAATMPKVVDKANVIYGAIIGMLSLIFGEHWILFMGFLILNVVDWLTGNYKARVYKKASSVVGAKGILKKVFYWVVIAIAFFVAGSFIEMGLVIGLDLGFVQWFGWLTLAMYIVNEIRSILENLVEIDVEVPEFLIKGLDVTKKLMEAKAKEEGNTDEEENDS